MREMNYCFYMLHTMTKLFDNSIRIQAIMNDPTTSTWLQQNLRLTSQRDPVDFASDARVLASTLEERADAILDAALQAKLTV